MRLHRRYALYRRYVSFVSSILSFISSIRLFCKFRLNYIAHFWSVVLVCSYFFRHIFVASSMRLFCRSLMIYIFLFWSVVLMHWYHFWHTSVAPQPSLMLDFSEVQQICVKRKKINTLFFEFLLTHVCRISAKSNVELLWCTTNMCQKTYKYIIFLCVSLDSRLSHSSGFSRWTSLEYYKYVSKDI